MNIKKFEGKTEEEAIRKAKEELGSHAIVMNVKAIQQKGINKIFKRPVYEVTAAVDDATVFKEVEKPKPVIKPNIDIIVDDKPVKPSNRDSASAIEEKLNNLQDLLEKQIEHTLPKEDEKEEKVNKNIMFLQLIYNQMINNEVDEVYANQIISEVEANFAREATVDNILAGVYQRIILKLGQAKSIELTKGKPRIVFFIGPTGVGKTTTIAKIASTFKINENYKIALLTSDTYRIAAVEQLRTYGNILGLPLKVIYTSDEIEEIVREYKDYDLILIDTAGRSHRSTEQCKEIKELVNKIEEKEIYLVLSATTKYNDLIKITQAYSDIKNCKLIFTKVDETSSLGNILNVRMLTGAPIGYTTWGQSVPDDMGEFDAQKVAKQVLGGDK